MGVSAGDLRLGPQKLPLKHSLTVGAAIGLLLCMAMTILLFTVDTALWAATSALEACIPLLIRGKTSL